MEVRPTGAAVTPALVSLRVEGVRPVPESAVAFTRTVSELLAVAQASPGWDEVEARHRTTSALMGQRVRAVLLPRGDARGVAESVDRTGALVLRSPTGMTERVAPGAVRRVEPC